LPQFSNKRKNLPTTVDRIFVFWETAGSGTFRGYCLGSESGDFFTLPSEKIFRRFRRTEASSSPSA